VQNSRVFVFEEAVARLRAAIEFVNLQVVDRVDIIDQIFIALLMREHALLQSRTGAAKSLLARQVFVMFSGAATFQVQASKEQQPDTYFGGLDIEELKKGRMVHNTADSIVESEFAFIDEIFDANDYTLRALLTTLNERALVLGAQQVPAKLHSAVAATNYLRVSEITEALLDRFLFKSLVIPSKTPAVQYHIARRYMAHGGRPVRPPQPIPYAELAAMSAVVKGEDAEHAIRVPAEIIFFANSVVRYYEMQRNRLIKEKPQEHPHLKDFYISPRSYARGVDLLRAIAFLHGRDEATTSPACGTCTASWACPSSASCSAKPTRPCCSSSARGTVSRRSARCWNSRICSTTSKPIPRPCSGPSPTSRARPCAAR
jgi:MoxR-like ATPase